MLARCYNPNHPKYPLYGGRGITVCDRWRDSVENFLSDMGEVPPGHTLDRIQTNGNYTPENCRWATPSQQSFNRRAYVRFSDNPLRNIHQRSPTNFRVYLRFRCRKTYFGFSTLEEAQELRDLLDYEKLFHSALGL